MAIIKTTYKDQVIEYIYELVLEGNLVAGDQVKESVLAKEMGISRAPIREALKELISNGIIEYKPQVGNFVPQLSPKEIIDAYTTRGILEGYAAMDTSSLFTADELDELTTLAERMQKHASSNNRKKVVEIGSAFHDKLISKNKNIQLIEYTNRLSQKLHILFYRYWSKLYSPEEIGNRHLKIVQAMRSEDCHEIEKTVREHYTETGIKIAEMH